MSGEAGGILDTTNTIGIQNFDVSDANWKGWRVKFEAYADLANMVTHLDAAAEQSSFIRHDGVDDNSLLVSKNASCLAHHEVRRQSSVSGMLVPLRHGLVTWRVLQGRVRGQRWKSYLSAPERHPQPAHVPDRN